MKPSASILRWAAVAAVPASILLSNGAEAATLAVVEKVRYDVNLPPGVSNNLTTQGSVDWAYWAAATGSGTSYGTNMVPTNEKSGGTAISNLSIVGSGNLRASDSADGAGAYSWSDGTSPISGTNQNLAGGLIFSSALNTGGAGFSLTVTGATAGQTYYVMLYFGGYNATGNLTLTLPGVTSVTDNTQVFAGVSPKAIVGYQVSFTPDNAGDQLSIRYTGSSTTASGHVGIEAVAVSTSPITPVPSIPEPSAVLLSLVGSMALIRRKR